MNYEVDNSKDMQERPPPNMLLLLLSHFSRVQLSATP